MAGFSYTADDGYPMVDLDSDLEQPSDSSEDEVDVILHGMPEQKRRLRRRSLGKESSSEDEFEKEMAAELNKTMKKLNRDSKTSTSSTSGSKTSDQKTPKRSNVYDKMYFDSDSDEELTSAEKTKVKHGVISNDDLFYDPKIDDENQKWIDNKRRKYQPKTDQGHGTQSNQSDRTAPLPQSDAVLNCPACMTVLCLDCQRHEIYKNQYRAMFVMNCDINQAECLKFPKEAPISRKQLKKSKRKQKWKRTAEGDKKEEVTNNETSLPEAGSSEMKSEDENAEVFHPVKCSICTTEVGVYDNDEVYHFFNVLASHA